MNRFLPSDRAVRFGLLACLAVLFAHALVYRFLCDDAFISFRYAHNLASGHGLVFNPGHERVEGYTNFLWVIVLAAFDVVRARPEHVAPVLSLLLTVVLWGLVARASSWIPAGSWRVAFVLPAAWLALTRSVAVWSTSGLETRLFEVLVVAGVVRLVADVDAASRGERRAPVAAFLFALATMTRPDGLLIGGSALVAAAAALAVRRSLRIRDVIASALAFGGPIGAHLLFRHAYYGEWVPNTYFAKVGGRSWWDMGAAYLACCALEYAAWLWIPLLASGVSGFFKDARAHVPLILGAAIVPHALYVASIGGDHFEFRPLDLYFPLLFLVMGRGAAALAGAVLSRKATAAYAVLLGVGLIAIPWQSHRQFPADYKVGFPGLGTAAENVRFLEPSHDPVYRWPGVRLFAQAHRSLLRTLTSRLVAVRQEEHVRFLATVVPEGRRLGALVHEGTIPADTHVAMSAVGAIPYYSNLRVLDKLGLTDAVVAKSAPGDFRMMAHDRHATLAYARTAGVDLWTEHPVHLLNRVDDENLVWRLQEARTTGVALYFADVSDGDYIVAELPQGLEKTAPRFPRLAFRPASEDAAYFAVLDAVIAARRRRLEAVPDDRDAESALGSALSARGLDDEALPVFQRLADAGVADGWYDLGTILARKGSYEDAASAFRKAIALDPSMGPARHNLGLALARAGHLDDAIRELREAVRLEPASEGAIYTLGVALLTAGDRSGVAECIRSLNALKSPQADALAERLGARAADQSPR